MAVIAAATAAAIAGGSSEDNNGAALDTKGRGAEVICVEGNNKDCSVDAGSLLAAVVRLRRQWKQQ